MEKDMSARTKLNGITFAVVLIFAALLGGAANSWLIFVLVTMIGTVLMIHAGEVRLGGSEPHPARAPRPRRNSR
jgi:hypothetical protein